MKWTLKNLFLGKSKLINLLYASIYIILFTHVWRTYCVPIWSSFNYRDVPHDLSYEIFGFFIALFPIIFYKGILNVSSWISLILYYFGYVPIVLGLLFNFPENNSVGVVWYWIVLFIAMSAFFLADRSSYKIKKTRKSLSINVIWWFSLITFILMFVTYRGNMRIVNFREIYDLREQNSQIGGGFLNYLNAWSATFTFPFVFCYGLLKRNKKFIIIGILLFVFLYSIFGLKTHLLAPLILILFFIFFKWQDNSGINLIPPFTLGISTLSIILLFNLDNPTVYLLAAVFLMRTLTISGCLFAGYYVPYFHNHPNTYFTHVNIIDYFTGANPYHGQEIGKVVSEGGMNANAIFWAMDGVTAMGVAGVAIISLIFLIFLIFLNAFVTSHNKAFVCTMMILPTIALLNVSFFTFILSEGVLLLILTLLFVEIPFEDKT